MNEQLEFLAYIVERLEQLGIAYMVTGSWASALYARPRMTRDIDLVVDVQHDDVDRLVSAFSRECLIDAEAVRGAINRSSMFNVIHREWATKVDFVVKKSSLYRQTEFDRRQKTIVRGVNCCVVSIEDLILSKLVWRKDSRSEIQLLDIRALLRSHHQIDRAYLLEWAKELGVSSDLLEAERNG